MRSYRSMVIAAVAAVSFGGAAVQAATLKFANAVGAGSFTTLGTSNAFVVPGDPLAGQYTAKPNTDPVFGAEKSIFEIATSWANSLVPGAGTVTFTRLFDAGVAGSPNIATTPNLSNVTDQTWTDGTVDVALKGAYSSQGQWLGTSKVGSGTAFTQLVRTENSVTFTPDNTPGTTIFTGGTPFNFFRSNTNSIATDDGWSNPAFNTRYGSPIDRMISFLVTGPGVFQPTYAIFFEDGSDNDYQDLAVLWTGVQGTGIPVVPLPTTVLMGGALFAAMSASRLRRRTA